MRPTVAFLFLVVFVSRYCLATDDCKGGALVVPSSGPTVCLPLDDYMELQKGAEQSTEAPPPASAASSTQILSNSALLLYRYMSPLWLQSHANFTEAPSSVSAQTMEFANGTSFRNLLFKVKLMEAGVLNDNIAYSIQMTFFSTPMSDSDPIVQICDGTFCVGTLYWDPNMASDFGGVDSPSKCSGSKGSTITAPNSPSTNWNLRLEIHPNSTSGIIYVTTKSLTREYNQILKPSQGLHLKVCRDHEVETYHFHLFELALHMNN